MKRKKAFFALISRVAGTKIARVKRCSRADFLLLAALACALAAGTLGAAENAQDSPQKGKRKITEPTGTLEGYFVRVKSGISGEKELYYNKDGSLRGGNVDGMLGGDFALDESLLGDDADGASAFDFSPGTDAVPAENSSENSEENLSENSAKNVPAKRAAANAEKVVPADKETVQIVPKFGASANSEKSADEEEGEVDEHSILKKYSKTKNDFGLAENLKKIIGKDENDRYDTAFSMREWQNSSSYGIRRWNGVPDADGNTEMNYELAHAEIRSRNGGENVPGGLFDMRVSGAGERIFVRNGETSSAVEVRLDERFSSKEIRPIERARSLNESSGLSMQDINRYQFRRNRPSVDGLPVVSPGGNGDVQMKKIGGKSAGTLPANSDAGTADGGSAKK